MNLTDPSTGAALPADAIQRILHISRAVHVYHIPPLTSTKGYTAASWTEDPRRHISTCRLRIIETAIPLPSSDSDPDSDQEKIQVDIVLEDPSTGALFAAAPYSPQPSVVEPALDSSRFFAIRVQDPAGGRKATLGIGFEERSEAFDFSIALQEAQKSLSSRDNKLQQGGGGNRRPKEEEEEKKEESIKRDYSLKEGETITINLGGTSFGGSGAGGRVRGASRASPSQQHKDDGSPLNLSSFALPPPPGPGGGSPLLPPPPSAKESRSRKRLSAQQLGFDDGQFGEFA